MPFAHLEYRGILTISGSDREAFLQGLVSNDVAVAMQEKPVWAALLTPQGKFKHDFFILGQNGRLLLECEGGDRLIDLGRTLRRFILRSDVNLGIENNMDTLVVWGEEATGICRSGDVLPFADGLSFSDPRLPELGVRILAPAATVRAALEAEGIGETSVDEWHSHRIALGVPDGSRDMDVEKSTLLEAGFDELNGVDWVKGCYMGQELTARTKYRGLIKRRLVPVSVEGAEIASGDDVMFEDRVVGSVKSVAITGKSALANLKLEAVTGKSRPLRSGEAVLTPCLPTWLALPSKP